MNTFGSSCKIILMIGANNIAKEKVDEVRKMEYHQQVIMTDQRDGQFVILFSKVSLHLQPHQAAFLAAKLRDYIGENETSSKPRLTNLEE